MERYMTFNPISPPGVEPPTTDFNAGILKKMVEILSVVPKDEARHYLDSPSFWILKNEDRRVHLDVFKQFCRSLRRVLTRTWGRFNPSGAIEPTFLLSETPGYSEDESAMTDEE
jgi:hypothetical protein